MSEVKAQPTKASLRTYLFQLLSVLGLWDRALQQLQVAAQLDAAAIPMAQTYREAIRSELLRAEIFKGLRAPTFLGAPPEWGGLLVESLRLMSLGQNDAADAARTAAFDKATETSCLVDNESCAWIADADSRLGPILEVIANGQYYWLPFEHINEIRIEAPVDLRDLVWLPAQLVLANKGEHIALIPSRYVGSESAGQDALKLGRLTEWEEIGDAAWRGLGQRTLVSDKGEHPILTVRRITIKEQSRPD